MIDPRGPYRIGAFFLAISGGLHIFAFLLSGLSGTSLNLIPMGLVYLGFAIGLLRGWRWLAYLAFLVGLAGSILALGAFFGDGAIPGWCWALIIAANLCAVLGLFAALWRAAPEKVTRP